MESLPEFATGTTRVTPDAAPAPSGTTRMDVDAAVAQGGTTRMDAVSPAAGAVQAPATGPAGTTVMGAKGDAAASERPAAVPAAPTASDDDWQPGQSVVLNGVEHRLASLLVARTGEATTYEAWRGTARVVLKRYHRGLRMPRPVLERLRERPHAHLVRLVDLGQVDGRDVEVLDFVEGGTLADYLRLHGPLRDCADPAGRVRQLVRCVLAGLEHLHQGVGAIYQDLKPENILLESGEFSRARLADFGISTLFAGTGRVIVTANGTKEYAAPELARFGNQVETQVDIGVDYFALGITLLECWTGKRPFQGIPDAIRLAQIRDKEVVFPPDMDPQLHTLIQGLIDPLPKSRWGREQIQRWLDGKPLDGAGYDSVHRQYERKAFDDSRSFSTPAELATLLASDPKKGEDHLYLDRIRNWLDAAGDVTRSLEIEKLTRQFDRGDDMRRAGLTKAIYVLDPERPFVTAGGRPCRTGAEFGDALLAERAHYMTALANPLDPFHLYLQATGESDSSTSLLEMFQSQSRVPTALAFNTAVYNLQAEGSDALSLQGQLFRRPADFQDTDKRFRDALVRELTTDHSRAHVWLKALGLIKSTRELDAADPIDLMSVLQAFPWLRAGELLPQQVACSGVIAVQLVQAQRNDLLEVFRDQGLDLDARGQSGRNALQEAAAQQATASVARLLSLGASVDARDVNGDTSLCLAVRRRDEGTAGVLLNAGANPNAGSADYFTVLTLACSDQVVGGRMMPVATRLVELLLDKGADPDQADGHDRRPLHLALASGADVQTLLTAFLQRSVQLQLLGKDTVLDPNRRCNALMCAMLVYEFKSQRAPHCLALVEQIIAAGAKVNDKDPTDGKTPLHFAAQWGSERLCELLLRKGADPMIASTQGVMPMHLAQAGNFQQLAQKLAPGPAYRARQRLLTVAELVARCATVLLLGLSIAPLLAGWHALAPATSWRWIGGYFFALSAELVVLALAARNWKILCEEMRATFEHPGFLSLLILGPALVPAVAGLFQMLLLAAAPAWSVARVLLESSDGLADWAVGSPRLAVTSCLVLWPAMTAGRFALTVAVDRGRRLLPGTSGMRWRGWGIRLPRMSAWPLPLRWIFWIMFIQLFGMMVVWMLVGEAKSPATKTTHGARPAPNGNPGASAAKARTRGQEPKPVRTATTIMMTEVVTRSGAHCALQPDTQVELKGPDVAPFQLREITVPVLVGNCTYFMRPHEVVRVKQSALHVTEPAGNAPEPASRVSDRGADSAANRAPGTGTAGGTTDPTPTTLRGAASDLGSGGWPLVDGHAVRLWGVKGIAGPQQDAFRQWLAAHGALDCTALVPGLYRCFTAQHVDVAEAILLNGAATATLDAPANYRSAMAQAQAAHRGLWVDAPH